MAVSDESLQRQLLIQAVCDANSARAELAFQIKSDILLLGGVKASLMKKKQTNECKYKGCDNPVLEGKYCAFHTQEKKEKRDKRLLAAGGLALLPIGVVIKKGALKKVPKGAAKVVQLVLKR